MSKDINLDVLADQIMFSEEERIMRDEAMDEMENSSLYLVSFGDYSEFCSTTEELNFMYDEAEARGLLDDVTVEKLDY